MSINPLISSKIIIGTPQNIVNSISVSTGSLVINGGTGIYGNTNVGGNIAVFGNMFMLGNASVSGNAILNNLICGNVVLQGNIFSNYANIYGNIYTKNSLTFNRSSIVINNGTLYINNPTQISNSTTTGCLVINGGLGISGSTSIGNPVTLTNSTANGGNGSTVGALVINNTGGAYIAGTMTVGGALWVGTGGTLFQVTKPTGVTTSSANIWTALNTFNNPIFVKDGNFSVGMGLNVYGTSGTYNGAVYSVNIGSYSCNAGGGQYSLTIGYKTNYLRQRGTVIGSQAGYSGGGGMFIGYKCAYNFDGGAGNTMIGAQSGFNLGSWNSDNNTFVGYQSGYNANYWFMYNTSVGYQAGYSNNAWTSGLYPAFLGYMSAYGTSSIVGLYLGALAAFNNNTSSPNNAGGYATIAIGYQSGANSTGGGTLLFIGNQSGYNIGNQSNSVFLGYQAGYNRYVNATTSGSADNGTYLGYQAGYGGSSGTTYGNSNSFLGYQAGFNITSGSNNICVGSNAGYNITVASDTICIGSYSGYNVNQSTSNGNGLNCIYIGFYCGHTQSRYVVGNNICIGTKIGYQETGTSVGGAGSNNSNVLIGSKAGSGLTISCGIVFIGTNAGASLGSRPNYNSYMPVNYVGAICIGYNTGSPAYGYGYRIYIGSDCIVDPTVRPSYSGTIYLGGTGPYSVGVRIPSTSSGTTYKAAALNINSNSNFRAILIATSFNASSDYRIKTNIVCMDSSYKIDILNPVSFFNKLTKTNDIGFLAHEIQSVYSALANGEKDAVDDENEPVLQTINYNGIIALLINEVQYLKKRTTILENMFTDV
jgi:hypothetical protein